MLDFLWKLWSYLKSRSLPLRKVGLISMWKTQLGHVNLLKKENLENNDEYTPATGLF